MNLKILVAAMLLAGSPGLAAASGVNVKLNIKGAEDTSSPGSSDSAPEGCPRAPEYKSETGFEKHVCRVYQTDGNEESPAWFLGQFYENSDKLFVQTEEEYRHGSLREFGKTYSNLENTLNSRGFVIYGSNINCDAKRPHAYFALVNPYRTGNTGAIYYLQGSLCERILDKAGYPHDPEGFIRVIPHPETAMWHCLVDEMAGMIFHSNAEREGGVKDRYPEKVIQEVNAQFEVKP